MNAKINAKLAILLGLSLLLMPFANALTVNDFFQNFYSLIENQYAFYTIMFLVTFIFLFSIFFGLTKYIPFFKGSGGNVSPGGQIFALSLSAGATLAFFSYIQGRGGAGYASGFFTNRVGSLGIWGWILLALLILAVVFFAFKKGKGFGFGGGEGGEGGNLKGLTALLWVLSFILVMYGSISKNRTITTIGAVLFVIALILTVLTGGFKFGKEGEPEPPHPPPVPPEPPDGYGTIYGVVSDKATKQEISHVRIECAGYIVIADPQGNYAVTVPVGQHALIATKQGYNNYRSNPIQVTSKARIEHNIEMEPIGGEKGTIEGRVLNLAEAQKHLEVGVEGAEVLLATEDKGRLHDIAPVHSDANGNFKFENLPLPLTKIVVFAQKEGNQSTHLMGGKPKYAISLDNVTKEEKEVVIFLEDIPAQKIGEIKGIVVDAYRPDKGIKADVYLVQIKNDHPEPLNVKIVCKDNGKFEMTKIPVPSDDLWVYAKKEDAAAYHSHPLGPIKLDLRKNSVDEVVVVLDLSMLKGTISGQIINKRNNQGIKAGILLKQIKNGRPEDVNDVKITCDDRGMFEITEIPVPSDNLVVYAQLGNAKAYHSIPRGPIKLDLTIKDISGVVVYLDITIQTGKIKGTVIDFNTQQPIRSTAGLFYGPTPTDIDLTRAKDMKFAVDGKFEFDNVQLGYYIVQGLAEGHESGKHTDPGGHPSDPIKIDANTPPVEGVLVPLKQKEVTDLPHIEVGLEGKQDQKLTAGDHIDKLIFYVKNRGGKALIDFFVELYTKNKDVKADWKLKFKRSIGNKFVDKVRGGKDIFETEIAKNKRVMIKLDFVIPPNTKPGIYFAKLIAVALKPGGQEYYIGPYTSDTKWYIIEVIRKEIEKELKETKRKTAVVKKEVEKDIRSKEAEATVKWADKEMLKDLKGLIDNIDEKIKILQDINAEECKRILREPRFNNNLKAIKTIYEAQSSENEAQLRRYEQYTYKKILRIAEIMSDFLDERIDAWHKHPK